MAAFQPTATPVRQIPGAFFNTPAPTRTGQSVARRLNFGDPPSGSNLTRSTSSGALASSNQNGNGLVASQAEPALPPVLKAARCVNQVLQGDGNYPDVDSYCRPGASSEYEIQSTESWAPFHSVQKYPIPEQIFERLNAGVLNTKLGLFAEINHAWASIDGSLFLWDYTHPDPEVIGYEESNHNITAVALVAPKPGVFVKTITHILVVANVTEVVLLGVAAVAAPGGKKSVSLYQTKMAIQRGNSAVTIIAGTANGRIFLGGDSDTDIHELYYQQEEKWFSSRCGKINHTHTGWSAVVPSTLATSIDFFSPRSAEHLVDIVIDNSRGLVYSLSSKSTIRTYHMESPEKLTKVIEKERNNCLRDIAHIIDRSPLLTDKTRFVALSPIQANEASKLHLMALTDSGCRLFLSATSSASYMVGATSNMAPQSMQVQFVKFPPAEQAALAAARRASSNALETGLSLDSRTLITTDFGRRFPPGYFFDVVQKDARPGTDLLFVSAPDTGRIRSTMATSSLRYYEQGCWLDLGDGSRALDVGATGKPFSAAPQPIGFGNELAVQFEQAPSEFAVLTNSGIHVVRRRRLVDIFATVIRGATGEEGIEREIRKFIHQYGRVETISAALAVSCGQGNDLRSGTVRAIDQATEDKAKTTFISFGGSPSLLESDEVSVTAESVKLSARHDALALYLTRLMRLIWKARVIAVFPAPAGGVDVRSTIDTGKLTSIQENLDRLKKFLEANKSNIRGLSGPSDLQRVSSRREELALQAEHQALHALQKLMECVSEGISFVLMLFDERVSEIYLRLGESARQQLRDLTYEGLFSQPDGKKLAKLLVKAVVNRNIESGSNVETVADALRRRCGSFCSPDDVVIFKAQEQLQRASEQASNPNVVRTLLNESLRLFERVAGSLTSNNLRGAVEQYLALRYYAGAIQLCLVVARERDRGNKALAWFNEGQPPNDPRERQFEDRKECYRMIHEVMARLDAESMLEPEMVDGRPTLAATKRNEAYNVVNESDDEVFHFDLYNWYIDQQWTDRILAIESPHVITFLRKLATTNPVHADLLCRFYTHRSRFFEAAQVQADLAQSDFPITIKNRITLLSRAKGNASVSTPGVGRQPQQVLNHEVTELLEIAHIQDDLLERLLADTRITDERKVEIQRALDGPIQSLTELFNNYADQAGYHDLSLLIYHAAEYHHARIITDTWRLLLETTHFDVEARRQAYEQQQDGAEAPPQPYEVIQAHIQTIAHRTSLDSLVFPIDELLPLVCEYAINNGQDATIGADPAWPVLVFTQLGVSHALLVRVLDRLFEAQAAPFTGRRRKVVVQWIDVAVEAWVHEVERRGGIAKGTDGAIGPWVSELLGRCDETIAQISGSTRSQAEADELTDIRRVTQGLRRSVDNLTNAAKEGSLMFR